MTSQGLFAASLFTSVVSSFALSAFLLLRMRTAAGAKQLAVFVGVVGLYALGFLAPPDYGAQLLALAPIGSVVFVDFVIHFTRSDRRVLRALYALGGGATLLQLLSGTGSFFETAGGVRGFHYEGAGLFGVLVAVGVAVYGAVSMRAAQHEAQGKRRRELAFARGASLVGLSTVASLAPPLVGVAVAPWSILALPIYPALMVYGVLRYELMEANLWARRAAAYTLVLLLAAALAALIAAAPLSLVAPTMDYGSLWLIVGLAMVLAFTLGEPIRHVADLVVYATPDISPTMIADWRGALARADAPQEALDIASSHLSAALSIKVAARFRGENSTPGLHCSRELHDWRVSLTGFEESPPGVQRVAIIYADLLARALDDIERRQSRVEKERLAELGLLASTIAHDLRNPLNIINMAASAAPPDARDDIIEQTRRMNRLVADLLDYARPWRLEPAEIDLGQAFDGVEATVPDGATLRADPLHFSRVIQNLLANARAAGGRIAVFVESAPDSTLIHVCDDGAGVPDEIRDRLFQPFVSRSVDGTGLGLAIVAKIMVAHGGTVTLTTREGFSTCVSLRFPA